MSSHQLKAGEKLTVTVKLSCHAKYFKTLDVSILNENECGFSVVMNKVGEDTFTGTVQLPLDSKGVDYVAQAIVSARTPDDAGGPVYISSSLKVPRVGHEVAGIKGSNVKTIPLLTITGTENKSIPHRRHV